MMQVYFTRESRRGKSSDLDARQNVRVPGMGCAVRKPMLFADLNETWRRMDAIAWKHKAAGAQQSNCSPFLAGSLGNRTLVHLPQRLMALSFKKRVSAKRTLYNGITPQRKGVFKWSTSVCVAPEHQQKLQKKTASGRTLRATKGGHIEPTPPQLTRAKTCPTFRGHCAFSHVRSRSSDSRSPPAARFPRNGGVDTKKKNSACVKRWRTLHEARGDHIESIPPHLNSPTRIRPVPFAAFCSLLTSSFDGSRSPPAARFARNGGVDAKDFQRLWREMDKAPASTTPYRDSTTLEAEGGREHEGPQGSRREAADGRIGNDKVFEVFSNAIRTTMQVCGLVQQITFTNIRTFGLETGGAQAAIGFGMLALLV